MPAGLQIRVVPGPSSESDRRSTLAVGGSPIGIESVDNAIDVAHGRACRIGVPAIGNHLHVGLQAGEQSALEILIDLDDEQSTALIDHRFYIRLPVQIGHAAEYARAI